MAKGSEQFAFKQFPGVARECAECGARLRVPDVARTHTVWPAGASRFYCRVHMHEGYGA